MRMMMPVAWLVACAAVVAAEEPPPLWAGKADVSYVATSGNTSGSTLGASGGISWRPGPYSAHLSGGFIRTVAEQAITSKRFDAVLRGERTVVGRFGGYLEASHYRDIFAGIRNQRVADIGGTYKLVTGEKHSLSVSTSLARTWDERSIGEAHNYFGIRSGFVSSLAVNTLVGVDTDSNYLRDLSDGANWKVRSAVDLVIGKKSIFAIKISHRLYYAHKPEPGKRQTDATVLVSLAVRWSKNAKS